VYQEVLYPPGEAFQVDWGDCGRIQIGNTSRRVYVLVAVLCYSRLVYIEFSLTQRKADFYRALVHALEFFGGSPRKIIFDNLKAAVLNGHGRSACLHPEFLALCGHFCLEAVACARRDPESKGVVEAGVRYVKRNALQGRSEELTRWEDYPNAAAGARKWPTCGSMRRPGNAPWIASRRNVRCCVPCPDCRSTRTRSCPPSSVLWHASSSTAIATPPRPT
jgi:hypothetical protein